MGEVKEYGTSCRKLLRAADTVGVSGALLGAHVSGARAHKEREGKQARRGSSMALTGERDDAKYPHFPVL